MGADCVLLIAAALDDTELADLHALAVEVGLDVLVEVHDEAEVERALAVGATLIGVNQRDLVTFEVDTDRAVRVAPAIPAGVVRVAESGIRGPDDAARLAAAGYDAVLVGESLVTSGDPAEAVAGARRLGRQDPPMTDRHPIFELSDRFVDELAALRAHARHLAGHPGSRRRVGRHLAGRRGRARSPSCGQQRAALDALPPADDRWAALAVRVLGEHIQRSLEPIEHFDHQRDLGHLQGLFPALREIFDLMDTTTEQGWRNIATRLGTIGEPLAGLRACLAEGMAADRWASKRQAESTIDQLRASVGTEGAFTQLVASFAEQRGRRHRPVRRAPRRPRRGRRRRSRRRPRWLEQEYLPGAPRPTAWARTGTGATPGRSSAPISTWPRPTAGAGTTSSRSGPRWRRWPRRSDPAPASTGVVRGAGHRSRRRSPGRPRSSGR